MGLDDKAALAEQGLYILVRLVVRRAFVLGEGRLVGIDQALQLMFRAGQAVHQLPEFALEFERHGMEPFEVVLEMGHRRFEAQQAFGVGGHGERSSEVESWNDGST